MSGFGLGFSTSVIDELSLKTAAALKAELNALLSANCTVQAAMVAQLVAEGRLVDAAEDDPEDLDELNESEELDGELDPFADDDELAERPTEDLSAGLAAATSDPDSVPELERHYTLRVIRRGDSFVCIPPQNPFAGLAQHNSRFAGQVLKTLRDQFAVYARLADMLNAENSDGPSGPAATDQLLASPAAFRAAHRPFSQKSFAAAHSLDPHTVGKAILNARLAWPDSSLPLKSVFRDPFPVKEAVAKPREGRAPSRPRPRQSAALPSGNGGLATASKIIFVA